MTKTITALIVCVAGLVSCNNSSKEQTLTGNDTSIEVPEFCEDSAYAYIEAQCAFGPRIMNSEAHEKCADYLARKFESFGAEVTEQYTDLKLYDGTKVKARNIIATYNGISGARILLCAHWDSRPWADDDPNPDNHRTPIDGANDGASGVGVLLEIARQIQMNNLEIGIDLICFDAEDSGLPQWAEDGGDSEHTWCLGSQHWAQNPHIPRYRARYGILLDMVGGNNTWFRKEGFSMYYAPSVVDKVWSAAQRLGYSNYFVNEEGGYITDDHLPLNRAAIPCINIIGSDVQDGGFCSTWHTVNDNLKNINKQTLKAVGQTVLEVIYNEK